MYTCTRLDTSYLSLLYMERVAHFRAPPFLRHNSNNSTTLSVHSVSKQNHWYYFCFPFYFTVQTGNPQTLRSVTEHQVQSAGIWEKSLNQREGQTTHFQIEKCKCFSLRLVYDLFNEMVQWHLFFLPFFMFHSLSKHQSLCQQSSHQSPCFTR